jgi:hypothetical protein
MKAFLALVGTGALAAALLVATSGASVRAASTGDTCNATGNGTAYSLNISIPNGAPQQGALAFGAGKVSVTNIAVPGTQGAFSTHGLPASTSGAWQAIAAMPSGSLVANLTTTGPVKGSFRVVPGTTSPTTYLPAISCRIEAAAAPSAAFGVHGPFAYSAVAGTWHATVSVPGPGRLSIHQAFAKPDNGEQYETTPLIRGVRLDVTRAGTVILKLAPTAAGKDALRKHGSIKLSLMIAFHPTNGVTTTSRLLVLKLHA